MGVVGLGVVGVCVFVREKHAYFKWYCEFENYLYKKKIWDRTKNITIKFKKKSNFNMQILLFNYEN